MKYYSTAIYLFDDKYKALARYVTQKYGLEVPYDFIMPQEIMFLPEIKPFCKTDDHISARWRISTITEK
mgnify:CR=1 FL=1